MGCGYVIDMFRMPYLVIQANKQVTDCRERKKKNISDAYTLWFPFGLFGTYLSSEATLGTPRMTSTSLSYEVSGESRVVAIARATEKQLTVIFK